ncbi:PilZ domain-containing protein [Reinekea blandensis]|uniref:PilZ domain-containing protein n=1 Tax=Reinekea blandensis MED297 TaxID=314283 RepID=A4BE13_9GAMM|nr:PilZ domain-containing protein [Reinekea blandensis]EAR09772.1 hypothetical protein MED297_16474 [Reinekea blandensis MED297]
MTQNDKTPEDRREAFRVDIKASVSLQKREPERVDPADYFQQLHTLSLYAQFQQLDQELNQVAERIKDLATFKSIDILRRQISALSKISAVQSLTSGDMTSQTVNISEGGCSFDVTSPMSIGDEFATAIIFQPTYFALFMFSEVVEVTPTESNLSRVHLRFKELTDRQTQQIVKHMFQAQTEQKNA